jgi:hypothetical protein
MLQSTGTCISDESLARSAVKRHAQSTTAGSPMRYRKVQPIAGHAPFDHQRSVVRTRTDLDGSAGRVNLIDELLMTRERRVADRLPRRDRDSAATHFRIHVIIPRRWTFRPRASRS